jgi:hypothetical protein
MHTANGLRHAEPLDRPPTWDQSTVCRGLYSAVSFYRISPCALFCRESVSKYTVRPIFAVCFWFIRREPLFCRALRYMAHGIIVNAVRRPTANAPHTEKEDFPVVYDEHSSKSSLSCETKVYRTSRRKSNFRRLMLASFATAPDNLYGDSSRALLYTSSNM